MAPSAASPRRRTCRASRRRRRPRCPICFPADRAGSRARSASSTRCCAGVPTSSPIGSTSTAPASSGPRPSTRPGFQGAERHGQVGPHGARRRPAGVGDEPGGHVDGEHGRVVGRAWRRVLAVEARPVGGVDDEVTAGQFFRGRGHVVDRHDRTPAGEQRRRDPSVIAVVPLAGDDDDPPSVGATHAGDRRAADGETRPGDEHVETDPALCLLVDGGHLRRREDRLHRPPPTGARPGLRPDPASTTTAPAWVSVWVSETRKAATRGRRRGRRCARSSRGWGVPHGARTTPISAKRTAPTPTPIAFYRRLCGRESRRQPRTRVGVAGHVGPFASREDPLDEAGVAGEHTAEALDLDGVEPDADHGTGPRAAAGRQAAVVIRRSRPWRGCGAGRRRCPGPGDGVGEALVRHGGDDRREELEGEGDLQHRVDEPRRLVVTLVGDGDDRRGGRGSPRRSPSPSPRALVRVATTRTTTPGLMSEIGPCFISPAGYASVGM